MAQMKVDTVIQRFVEVRDQRAELKRAWEVEDNKLKEALEKIEVHLMRRLEDAGVESFKTPVGTAYVSTDTKCSCADWPAMWEFLAENRLFSMLEKRLSISGVKEYIENAGGAPPYVNLMVEKVVRIRRT
jgi:hypothetical protein